MDIGVIAVAHGHVAQGGLHAALGCGAVGAPGRHQAEDGGGMSGDGGLDGYPFPRQTGADDQNISEMRV